MTSAMKILALNSSPRKEKGNTERILRPFLDGACRAGAETEVVYLYDKKILPCLGCFHCWLRTPGKCCQKDDMGGLLKALTEADLVVYATPLYVFGMSAVMKLFLDRIVPLAEPFVVLTPDGRSTHPVRGEKKNKGMVVVSNCGFHELSNFDELMAHFRAIAYHSGVEILGSLLRPEGEFLAMAEKLMPEKVGKVYEAAREAGRQVVTVGRVTPETERAVSAHLLSREEFLKSANAYFRSRIEAASVHPG